MGNVIINGISYTRDQALKLGLLKEEKPKIKRPKSKSKLSEEKPDNKDIE